MSLSRFSAAGLAAAILLLGANAALAHSGEGVTGGLLSGFKHPILGWDHLVAMVAVGLWGAILGSPAIWVLPIVFPLVMALGGAMGVAGMPLPAVEVLIAASGVVLGLLVALWVKAPIWAAAVIVGLFAIFHGHAHGMELPVAANPYAYAVGFVVGTGLLHVVGILLGGLTKVPNGNLAIRGAGLAIAAVGGLFLAGVA